MRRRGVGTSMPRPLSNTGSPSIVMRPRSGRRMPAMALTTEVLPAPERPKSAVTPSPASKAALRRNAPRRRSMSTVSVIASHPFCRTAHQYFRNVERGERKQHRNEAQPQRGLVSRRRLRIGIDRERQRARLAGYVGDESNGRAELSQAARKGQQHACDDSRQSQRQSDGEKDAGAAGAQRACRGFELAVDAFERKSDGAHHQGKTHYSRGQRRAGPPECEDYSEPFFEPRADGPAPAEKEQQEIADHDRRQHERQMDGRVEQRLPGKVGTRKHMGNRDREGQTHEHAPESDAQAEAQDLPLFGCRQHPDRL